MKLYQHFSKQDKALKKAFRTYEQSQNSHLTSRPKGNDHASPNDAKTPHDRYFDNYEDHTEDRIYALIQKIPIQNPIRKARRIRILSFSILLFLILFFCYLFYQSDRTARHTKIIQEIYREAAKNQGENPPYIRLADDSIYPYFHLTEKEIAQIEKLGENLDAEQRGAEKGLPLYLESDTQSSAKSSVKAYSFSDRKDRQYILIWDGATWGLGKFSFYYNYCDKAFHEENYASDHTLQSKIHLALSEDAGITGDKLLKYNVKTLLKDIFRITSAKDIRSVSLEKAVSTSKENPDKRIATWVSDSGKEWIYDFLSDKKMLISPALLEEETRKTALPVTWKEERNPFKSSGTENTAQDSAWKRQLQIRPSGTYYLAVENNLHEQLLFGIILEKGKAEIWLEPQINDINLGESPVSEPAECPVGVFDPISTCMARTIFLTTDEQRELAKVISTVTK